MTRSFLTIPVITFAVWLAGAGLGFAHDGIHKPKLLVDVVAAKAIEHTVFVELDLTNLGPHLALEDVTAQGASSVRFTPVTLSFAQDITLHVEVDFMTVVPGIFTAHLDFGVAGQGPVLIVPTFDRAMSG